MTTKEKELRAKEDVSPERMRSRPTVAPSTDVYEREDALVVVADMPGVDPTAVHVTLENGTLTIRGTGAEPERQQGELLHAEFAPVDYERSFDIAEEIDADKVTASARNGVLTVTLPKSPKAQPRRISVEVK